MAIKSNIFSIAVNALIWLLPEQKRKRWRRRLVIFASVILLLVLAFIVMQRIGPTADGPTEDPIERLNRVQAALSPNASDLYLEAISARTEPPPGPWEGETDRSRQPLSAELAAWIDENTQSINLTRRATRVNDCYFPLCRGRTTALDMKSAKKLRRHARFIALRARRAAEQHDLEILVDSLNMLMRMAHHASQQPGAIGSLRGMANRALAMEHCLSPYTWPELSFGQRVSYAATLAAILTPLPNLVEVLDYEREEMCWLGAEVGLADYHWYYPAKRWHGEIDRALRPYYDLAAQPVEIRVDPANPLWTEIAEMRDRAAFTPAAILNLSRLGATDMVSTMTRLIKFRARFVAWQRGLRTVAAIMEYTHATGRRPESLVALGGEDIIDPFTGKPFLYRTNKDGFTLYSAGLDGDDDGGQHHDRFGDQRERIPKGPPPPPDGDYVFWPLPYPEPTE